MYDIIEQLEAGKKLQEEEGIDVDSLHIKLDSSEEKTEQIKNKKKKQTKEELTDPFEQAEQIMNQPKIHEESKEQKPEKYPGFDYNNSYEIGQKIYFIRVHEKLGIKELMELKIRTIYPKTIIACEEKGRTQCIGPESQDMIFRDRYSAVEEYDRIVVKAYKDINPKDELGDMEINDTED